MCSFTSARLLACRDLRTCFAIRSCSGVNARPLPPPPPAGDAAAAAGVLLVADGRRRTPGDAPGAAPAPAPPVPPLLAPLLALPFVDENGAVRAPDGSSLDEDAVPLAPAAPLVVPAVPSCAFCRGAINGAAKRGRSDGKVS